MSTDRDSSEKLAASIDRWKGHLRRMQADGPSMEHLKQIDAHRKEIAKDVDALVKRFTNKEISVEEFKLEFQSNAPRNWESFAINGAAGGMLLNAAVKYIKDRAELATRLRSVLVAPKSIEEGRKSLNDYAAYLRSRVERKEITLNLAGVGRVPFFVSVFWYAQKPDQWPIFYPTTRKVFAEEKLFQPTADVVADYCRFCEAHNAVRDALGIDSFELEYLCIWLTRRSYADSAPEKRTYAARVIAKT